MKLSFIIWDASFREYFHTLRCLENQLASKDTYEVIWCDFYTNTNPELLKIIDSNDNFKLLNLARESSKWSEAICINEAVKNANYNTLVLIDGDIFFDTDLVNWFADKGELDENSAIYLRRYDEQKENYDKELSYTTGYLDKSCKLNNPFNYAGFVALRKSLFEKTGGYETHSIFYGPGGVSTDFHIRLLNAHTFISFGSKKIYHPWHPNTGRTDKYQKSDILFSKYYSWINGYIGIRQSWILKRRKENLSYSANEAEVNKLLTEIHPRLLKLQKYIGVRLALHKLLKRFGI
jgi:hypothetical protein